MLVRAFVPAHVTAFFVPLFNDDPLKAGSLGGAGLNLEKGGTTVFVSTEEDGLERHIHVAFNGEPVKRERASISYSVAEELVPADFRGEVEIWQYFDFPNGYGFGNSAGGSAGDGAGPGLHLRGDVARGGKDGPQVRGSPQGGRPRRCCRSARGRDRGQGQGRGGPGGGRGGRRQPLLRGGLPRPRGSPREALDEGGSRWGDVVEAIETEGGKLALEKLLMEPRPERMMVLAREFAERTGLLSGGELLELAGGELDGGALKLPSSMIMLGRGGLFALLHEKEVDGGARALLSDLGLPYDVTGIYDEKPKVGRWIG